MSDRFSTHTQLFDDCRTVFRMHNRVAFTEHETP